MHVLLRGIGIGLIALAVCLTGLIGYQLIGTHAQSSAAATALIADLDSSWASAMVSKETTVAPASSAPASSAPASSAPSERPPKVGAAFGKVYIPRLKDNAWGLPLTEGIEPKQIDAGFAHFPRSAMPGAVGNLALAAHRATHLEPLAYVDRLREGDEVIIRTRDAWYVYELTHDRIVPPSATWVVDPVPGFPRATPIEALLTLVTCEPRWGHTSRWIWWGTLREVRPVSQTPTVFTHA